MEAEFIDAYFDTHLVVIGSVFWSYAHFFIVHLPLLWPKYCSFQNLVYLVWLEGWKPCRARWILKWSWFVPRIVSDWIRQLGISPYPDSSKQEQKRVLVMQNEEEFTSETSVDITATFKSWGVLVHPSPLGITSIMLINRFLQLIKTRVYKFRFQLCYYDYDTTC